MIVLHPLLKLFFNTGKHWFARTNTKYPIFSAYGVRTGRVGIPRISMCGRVGILGGEHHKWNKKIGRKFVTIRDLAITLLLDAVYAPVGEHSVVATEWIRVLWVKGKGGWFPALNRFSEGIRAYSEELLLPEAFVGKEGAAHQQQRKLVEDRCVYARHFSNCSPVRYKSKDDLKFVQQVLLDIWAYYLRILEKPDISFC